MSDFLRGLETGAWGEIGTVAFVVAFLAACAYVFTLSRRDRETLKNLPLDDVPPAPPPGDGAPGPAPDAPRTR